jgi:hypothetical protein
MKNRDLCLCPDDVCKKKKEEEDVMHSEHYRRVPVRNLYTVG